MMFDTVLIANRGEIACRVIKTLRAMGIRSVAVYSDADAHAKHVREADIAVRIGPAAARDSYLSIDNVIAAAKATGAQAIHPGYGFLSENVDFARALDKEGIVFIGPPASAVEVMGDKIRAKNAVGRAGVPVVPGRTDPGMTDDDLIANAAEIGYPVLIKPSAGGGGKGMHLVESEAGLASAIVTARREAATSFGDDTLFLERFVSNPRHIEVQVLADAHGHTIHLGERECSLQRRHQKIIEEAPSALLDQATRDRIGKAAVDTAAAVNYAGAGTVEFIVSADAPDEFFFMEMNTRLQVEHPVTEMVTGLDLVEQQLRVAAGEPLSMTQDDLVLNGHAVEARVYAENPARDFLPTGGRVLKLREPDGVDVRVDSSLLPDAEVGTTYDPMLAKVVAWGEDRAAALSRLDRALGETVVLGVTTNLRFLRALINHPDVRAGKLDTGLVGREIESLTAGTAPTAAYAAFALHHYLSGARHGLAPWDDGSGWRAGRPNAPVHWTVQNAFGETIDVRLRVTRDARMTLTINDNEPLPVDGFRAHDHLHVTTDGVSRRALIADDGDTTWIHIDGATAALRDVPLERAAADDAVTDGEVRSPMPGTVLAVHVEQQQSVAKATPLVVVEAMKMEHVLVAPIDGVTSDFALKVGQLVAVDQLLLTIHPDEAATDDTPTAKEK
ncbi:acetyl-CoA/propionyl-CoA carboxylase, biotin carboxylase, biotin carboxyl carrier protein [Antricoccus suffuscus]|uniref:biotin carboxylase n=1 Tax=Antricoccus suffuscus TaxID=1629062 RepID=A0A2T1A260_9ACTN|nr:acetyl-CoA carboxylase biotin carboxylase subunit [Antricoccus suffuscus]PRZ42701.1 acetyl-CoA/propionyl-CoA carboxylase, biotin carboxylase, biotin carboxyl carrier protein [Antricoccus suffuscus]